MGYDLHVTRKEHWFDETGPTIDFAEWVAYIASDPEVVPDWENPGPENARFAAAHGDVPLWWDDGEVLTKNPAPDVIAKLVRIARALGARVQGDEGELYGTDPNDPTKPSAPET